MKQRDLLLLWEIPHFIAVSGFELESSKIAYLGIRIREVAGTKRRSMDKPADWQITLIRHACHHLLYQISFLCAYLEDP